MIRPVAFVTAVMMLGSGAWMFVVKHRAEQLDQKIGTTTAQIRSSEQRIRVLRAEWALETDPNRLQRLAAMFLPRLQPMKPDQLVTMQELADRLPAPGAAVPYLPLPPPLPSQLPDMPAPAMPAAPIAAAVPPAALPLPPRARPVVKLAAGETHVRATHHQARARRVAVTHRRKPVLRTREAARAPQRLGASVLALRPTKRPMGAQVMPITASAADMRLASPTSSAPALVAPRSGQRQRRSVFGNYGADLPPPRPVGTPSP